MKIFKMGLILLFWTSVSGASLSLVYISTEQLIAEAKSAKIIKLQKEILPQSSRFEKQDGGVVLGFNENGEFSGKMYNVNPQGYASAIEMIVGINEYGKIIKIKVAKQNETPGLGTHVSSDGFLSQFAGKGLKEIELKKDSKEGNIDAIAGATISSRALVKGAKEALTKFEDSRKK